MKRLGAFVWAGLLVGFLARPNLLHAQQGRWPPAISAGGGLGWSLGDNRGAEAVRQLMIEAAVPLKRVGGGAIVGALSGQAVANEANFGDCTVVSERCAISVGDHYGVATLLGWSSHASLLRGWRAAAGPNLIVSDYHGTRLGAIVHLDAAAPINQQLSIFGWTRAQWTPIRDDHRTLLLFGAGLRIR